MIVYGNMRNDLNIMINKFVFLFGLCFFWTEFQIVIKIVFFFH